MIKATRIPARIIFEVTLGLLSVIILYFLLANFALGGPLSTDVTAYANQSINGLRDPEFLNRYFHIFLQTIFIRLASTPLQGLQNFWAFLISSICGSTYLAARIIQRRSQALHGLIAVLLFLSIQDIAHTAGIALVDITAMFMMLLFIVIFFISARRNHNSAGLVILLVVLFYLGFRTKETAVLVGLPLLGLGWTVENSFDWRLFLRRMLYVIIGILCGIGLFIILNLIFVKDPWFGFRLTEIRVFFGNYVSNIISYEKSPGTDNWFTAYLFSGLLVPFCLYLISTVKIAYEKNNHSELRLVWILPLVVIAFVTLSVNSQWGFAPRYLYTILPFVCFIAPQYLELDLSIADKKQRVTAIITLLTGLVLILIARIAIRFLIPGLGWDIGSYLNIVFIPILLLIILVISIYWKIPSLVRSMGITALIIGIITIPLAKNIKVAFHERPNYISTQKIFYPFSTFQDQIHFFPNMRMYVSPNTWKAVGERIYTKDLNEISAVFNIYFDAGSISSNFFLPIDMNNAASELLTTNYNYALISLNDWNSIQEDKDLRSQLKQKYQVFLENKNLIVLLSLVSH